MVRLNRVLIVSSEFLTQIGVAFMNGGDRFVAVFECKCGNLFVARISTVKRCHTKSCGCLRVETTRIRASAQKVHGETGSAEHFAWIEMKRRCRDMKRKHSERYSQRGIVVCERWALSFSDFLSDMGRRPSANHSLDRIDNDGDYTPENCRWATDREQNANRSSVRLVTANGQTHCIAEWARMCGLTRRAISERLRKGIHPEKAVAEAFAEKQTFRILERFHSDRQ